MSPDIACTRYTEEFERLAEPPESEGRAEDIEGATPNDVNLTIN